MELWDIIRPSDATRFAREVPIPQSMDVLNRLVPDRVVNSFKPRIRTVTRTLTTARFRVYNAENWIGKRPVVVSITDLELPPLGQKLLLLEREILEMALAGQDPNGDVIQQVYDDIEHNVRATRARMHLAKGDLLTDGKITITENGLVGLEADFELANNHKPTASVLWSDPAALALTEERAWIKQMVDDGSPRPDVALTSSRVADMLAVNDEYRAAFWGGNAGMMPNLNPEQVDQVRRTYRLPPLVIDDSVVDVDGVTTRAIPDTKFILITNSAAEAQWGVTAQALTVVASAKDPAFTRRDAPGIFTAAYMQTEPAIRETSTYAIGMPLLLDRTQLVSATVAA